MYRYIDAAKRGPQGFTEDFYRRVCFGHLEPVLETLRYLRREDRCLAGDHHAPDPGRERFRRGDRGPDAMGPRELGADVPLHFTAFHPDFKMPRPAAHAPSTLTRAREIGLRNGCATSIRGTSTTRREGRRTARAAGRRSSAATGTGSRAGRSGTAPARAAARRCLGSFEERPGRWGPRGLPVRVGRRNLTTDARSPTSRLPALGRCLFRTRTSAAKSSG